LSIPGAQELPPLPHNTRIFIVITALVQGGLLYLARYAQLHDWWLASLPGWSVFNFTLILTVPIAMTLLAGAVHLPSMSCRFPVMNDKHVKCAAFVRGFARGDNPCEPITAAWSMRP